MGKTQVISLAARKCKHEPPQNKAYRDQKKKRYEEAQYFTGRHQIYKAGRTQKQTGRAHTKNA
jgi:hypothetical protein